MFGKCLKFTLAASIAILSVLPSTVASAATATAPALAVPAGLSLAEIKITGTEFVMLQNNTGADITDLGSYWLYGFNKTNPLDPGVSSSSQQLPGGTLANGQTVLLSDGGATCGAAITDSLSISLGDSAGYLEVVKSSLSGGVLVQTAGDAVSWSSGTNTTSGMISKVPSNTADPFGAYYRYLDNTKTPPYQWQQADIGATNACQMTVKIAAAVVPGPTNPGSQLQPGLPPPATIVSIPSDATTQSTTTGLPAADIGLRAPVLNELLPNPKSPQTDANDEFVELYNSNDTTFDLSGFKLQTKSSTSQTKYTYTFPGGTKIAGHGFAAYPSANISISLSNTAGQIWLLDPSGNVISQTEAYGKAKDGLAWALANGHWYWTTTPTPGAANSINGSAVSGTGSSVGGNGVGTVKGASTTNGATSTSNAGNGSSSNADDPPALHPSVLVGVGAAALLYGAYEYRGDLANNIYRIRRYRTARRETRQKA